MKRNGGDGTDTPIGPFTNFKYNPTRQPAANERARYSAFIPGSFAHLGRKRRRSGRSAVRRLTALSAACYKRKGGLLLNISSVTLHVRLA